MTSSRKEYDRIYYDRNREKRRAQRLQYRIVHLEEEREKDRIRSATPERRALAEEWRTQNRARSNGHRQGYKARKRNAFIECVNPELIFERDAGVCQICLLPIGESKWHIDHVMPLSKGGEHSYANTQLSHAVCNMKKHARVGV